MSPSNSTGRFVVSPSTALHSHRIQFADPMSATIRYAYAVNGKTPSEIEAANGDYMMDRFELSEPPLPPSSDPAKARRIVTALPDELAERNFILRKPLEIDLEVVSRGNVVASFRDSESHMSGADQDDAIRELTIWMAEEYANLSSRDPSSFGYPLRKKWKALNTHFATAGHVDIEQS